MITPMTLHMIGCDHCIDLGLGSEAYWYDGETDAPMLLGTPDDVANFVRETLVKEEGWTTDGTRHHCESCSKLRPLVDLNPVPVPEPVPVLSGQIPLGGSE